MPEGPSIAILKESVQVFVGKKIIDAFGNTKKIDLQNIKGSKIIDFKTWGKHFLICLPSTTLRIHFLMFGSYRINETRENMAPRLTLRFSKNEFLNFYACSIIPIEKPLDDVYDWTADVMNEAWNSRAAMKKLKAIPETLVCDALLDQRIFSGVGNIIKNEVLFRIGIHPQSKVGKMPVAKKRELIREAVHYSFQFFDWRKAFELKKHYLVYTKKVCPRDAGQILRKNLGKTNRRTFYCATCQKLYTG